MIDLSPVTKKRVMDEKATKKIAKLGPFMSYITLIKGFIGSGVLYLPNSYYNGGYGF